MEHHKNTLKIHYKDLPEHKDWSLEQIRDFLTTSNINYGRVSTFCKTIKEEVIKQTNFISELYDKSVTDKFSTRCSVFINGWKCVDDIPLCEYCGKNKVSYSKNELKFKNTIDNSEL